MFPREFTYPGFDGKEHTETWWFNLSEAELMKMQLSTVGGVDGMMNRMLREENPGKIVDMFETIILKAVGERSIDGRRFIKKERPDMPWGEVAEEFKETPAYSQLFMELVSSGEALSNFLKSAIPAETAQKIAKAEADMAKVSVKEEPVDNNVVALPVSNGETDAT